MNKKKYPFTVKKNNYFHYKFINCNQFFNKNY